MNVWESHHIDREFEIILYDRPLTANDLQSGDVILYSFMTSMLPGVHEEVSKARKKGVLIVGGGPHITGDQELPFKMGFDTLFVGPAEANFLRFGRDLLEGKPIKNLYTYEHSPDSYHDFSRYQPFSRYLGTIGPLEVMRGCYWSCSYCSTHFYKPMFRDLDSIDTYLRGMKERGVKRVNFISPSSMEYGAARPREINIEKIRGFLQLAQSYHFRFLEYGIFPTEIRPDTVTAEGLALLKQYVSNKSVTIGGQSSLDQRLLDLRRGHCAEDIERAVDIANSCGFSVNLDFIVGYPDETLAERRANIEFIKRLCKKYRLKAYMHFFIPLPGSAYGYRLPSFLTPAEKEQFYSLRAGGIITDGWIANEEQAHSYLDWLKENFLHYFSQFY